MNNKNKGLFLQEFYGIKEIPPLTDKEGMPTKFAEAAKYWGENIPKNNADVKQLVAKGAALIATNNLEVSQKFSQSSVYGGKQKLSIVRPNRIKVPFLKKGAWKHDVYGEVKFTDEDVEQLINNYKNNAVGFTPYLTLGHLDEEPESTDSHRKRGDLRDIIVEDDTAFGVFDVNDDLYNAVKDHQFEYSSGEFNRKLTNKKSGEDVGTAVIRVALTNSPFLPFGSQKVQALSDNSESCPESKENFVFLLSIDTSNSDASNEVLTESLEEPKEEISALKEEGENLSQTLEQQVETIPATPTPIENTKLINNKSIMAKDNKNQEVVNTPANVVEVTTEPTTTTVVETVAEEAPTKLESNTESVTIKESNPLETQKSNKGDEALNNLTSQLQKVQKLYETQLEAANKTINDLADKVNKLTDKLAGQEKVTQAFSNSMTQAQENVLIQNLQTQGVQPANIQKFLTFKNAFQTAENKNVVKFSIGVGEEAKIVEANVIDTVADLLISASNQSPLVEQQLGVSAGRKRGAFDFSSIIEKNRAAAQKLN